MKKNQLFFLTSLLMAFCILCFSSCGTVSNAASSGNNANGASASGLQGTDLGATPAPNFQLIDQHGKMISLSQFKGMPVVLTFFYTHCVTLCPLIAQKIYVSLNELGPKAQQIAIIAISADPKGDTPSSVLAFSKEHGLEDYANWHYLMGSRTQLAPIWHDYGVAGLPANATVMTENEMTHTSVVYLIDSQGREQVLLDSDFLPSQLTQDVTILLHK